MSQPADHGCGVDVSLIIPTIGRATLLRTVESLLSQEPAGVRCEVIVVNDSGRALPPADWLHSPHVVVVKTCHSERSLARDVGIGVARGRYVMLVDDDDYLLPGAVAALYARAAATGCPRVYGAYRLLNEAGEVIDEIHPHVRGDALALFLAGESIPLGCTLFERSMVLKSGAFSPAYSTLEDYDFLIRFALLAPLDFTDSIILCQRISSTDSSTDWSTAEANNRRMREAHIGLPEMFRRVLESSRPDPFARGRVTRTYLSSFMWNVKHDRPFTGAGRLAAAMRLAAPSVVSPSFWRGLRGMRNPQPAPQTAPQTAPETAPRERT
jgi:glycosyltransferase involved in cell wall biosynthesis